MAGTASSSSLTSNGRGWSARAFVAPGFEELAAALRRLAAAGGPEFSLRALDEDHETWFDTADHRILDAGLVLRVRDDDPERTAHLTPLAIPGALPVGDDGYIQSLDDGPTDAIVRAAGPVGTRVRSLAGARPLQGLVSLSTRHTLFEIREEGPRLQLRLEELHAVRPAGGGERIVGRLTIAEEGEAGPRLDGVVEALRQPCQLEPAPGFAETALDLAGVTVEGALDLGPEQIGPQPTVQEIAYASLRRDTRSFLAAVPRTRLGDDPEAVHDMRVAGRRLRAAFKLFADYLPKRAAGLRREIGRLGRILGRVRDLDVQLEQLEAWRRDGGPSAAPAFDALERVLRGKREAARRPMLRAFDAPRFARFVARLDGFLRAGPTRRNRHPARTEAPRLIGQRYRAVRKAGDDLGRKSPPEAFHRLRIRCKRLRYALEFHQPLYDGDVAAMIESLSALQALLGEHQDAWLTSAHLAGLAATAGRKLSTPAIFLMGTIAARSDRRAASLRRAFRKSYRKIRGRRKKAMMLSLAEGVAS